MRAESDGSALDGYLFLYDPDGNYLAEADNESTDTSFTLDPRLRFPVRRITSYNVCYTKLLRDVDEKRIDRRFELGEPRERRVVVVAREVVVHVAAYGAKRAPQVLFYLLQ